RRSDRWRSPGRNGAETESRPAFVLRGCDETETTRRRGMTKTFADFGIELPHGACGEVDVTCPQCSPTRKKKHARCLSVNADKGTWMCQHCGWSGGLLQGAREAREEHWRKPAFV